MQNGVFGLGICRINPMSRVLEDGLSEGIRESLIKISRECIFHSMLMDSPKGMFAPSVFVLSADTADSGLRMWTF